jgi:hypothetical protein
MAGMRRLSIGMGEHCSPSVALVALAVAVFAPVRHFSFVSRGDQVYPSSNQVVGGMPRTTPSGGKRSSQPG